MTYGSQAAAATHVFEQQRDLALRDRIGRSSQRVEPRSAARRGHVRHLRELRQADRARAAGGAPVDRAVHRLPAGGR